MKLLRFGLGLGFCFGLEVFLLGFCFAVWFRGFLVFFWSMCCAVDLLEQDDSSFYLLLGWGRVGFSLEFCGIGSVDRF